MWTAYPPRFQMKKKREQTIATNPIHVIQTSLLQSHLSLPPHGPSSFLFLPLKFLISPLQNNQKKKKKLEGKQRETMSAVAPSSSPSLCFSALSRTTTRTKQNQCLPFLSRHPISKNYSFSENSVNFCNTQLPRQPVLIVRASAASESEPAKLDGSEGGGEVEEYEVELDKPYGLKFAKGRDGGTYIDAIAPGGSADKSRKFTVGDKVIATRF